MPLSVFDKKFTGEHHPTTSDYVGGTIGGLTLGFATRFMQGFISMVNSLGSGVYKKPSLKITAAGVTIGAATGIMATRSLFFTSAIAHQALDDFLMNQKGNEGIAPFNNEMNELQNSESGVTHHSPKL